MSEKWKYYVYAYLDPRKPGNFCYSNLVFNCEPFYIGKGHGKRDETHLKVSQGIKKGRTDYNHHKFYRIKSILNDGLTPVIIRIYIGLDNENAALLEMCLIRIIGRRDLESGPLTNLTNGGESTTKLSQESRKKISDHKRMYPTSHMKKSGKDHMWYGLHRMGELAPHYGKPLSDEAKAKISKGNTGKIRTTQHKEAVRIAMLNRPKEVVDHIASFTKGDKNPRAVFYILKSPAGEEYTVRMRSGLKEFCSNREHGLTFTPIKIFTKFNTSFEYNGWVVRKIRIKEYEKMKVA